MVWNILAFIGNVSPAPHRCIRFSVGFSQLIKLNAIGNAGHACVVGIRQHWSFRLIAVAVATTRVWHRNRISVFSFHCNDPDQAVSAWKLGVHVDDIRARHTQRPHRASLVIAPLIYGNTSKIEQTQIKWQCLALAIASIDIPSWLGRPKNIVADPQNVRNTHWMKQLEWAYGGQLIICSLCVLLFMAPAMPFHILTRIFRFN